MACKILFLFFLLRIFFGNIFASLIKKTNFDQIGFEKHYPTLFEIDFMCKLL